MMIFTLICLKMNFAIHGMGKVNIEAFHFKIIFDDIFSVKEHETIP